MVVRLENMCVMRVVLRRGHQRGGAPADARSGQAWRRAHASISNRVRTVDLRLRAATLRDMGRGARHGAVRGSALPLCLGTTKDTQCVPWPYRHSTA